MFHVGRAPGGRGPAVPILGIGPGPLARGPSLYNPVHFNSFLSQLGAAGGGGVAGLVSAIRTQTINVAFALSDFIGIPSPSAVQPGLAAAVAGDPTVESILQAFDEFQTALHDANGGNNFAALETLRNIIVPAADGDPVPVDSIAEQWTAFLNQNPGQGNPHLSSLWAHLYAACVHVMLSRLDSTSILFGGIFALDETLLLPLLPYDAGAEVQRVIGMLATMDPPVPTTFASIINLSPDTAAALGRAASSAIVARGKHSLHFYTEQKNADIEFGASVTQLHMLLLEKSRGMRMIV